MKNFLLVILAVVAFGCSIVDTGHRGIRTTFGKITGEPIEEGLYFYNLFTSSITELDVRIQCKTYNLESFTRDIQLAKIQAVVTYFPDPKSIHILFKEYGRNWDEKIVDQVVYGKLKDVIGKWDAVDLVDNRDKARQEVETSVLAALSDKSVKMTGIEITNIDFDDAFEKAVEDKVVAVQRAIEAKNKTVQIQEEANQQIISAKAEAQSMSIRAQALSQNKSLVEWEAVQKWNGELPTNMFGSSVPFINMATK